MERLIRKIGRKIKVMKWVEIDKLGINRQIALRLRRGETPAMRELTVERVAIALKIA
jgi:hypothetical protein